MGFADKYIEKNLYTKIEFTRAPTGLLSYIVIIPAFAETQIFECLNSLLNCKPCSGHVEVLIHVNYPEHTSHDLKQQNEQIYISLLEWSKKEELPWMSFFPILTSNLPQKHAGVGLARKIAMDTASSRFSTLNKPNGLILSLDADTLVPSNYFTELDRILLKAPKTDCVIFNFKHPLKGSEFNAAVYLASCLYELHLRYYKHILQNTQFPFYHYTIGSCFAVSALLYTKLGGMSKRKAGEDFYFLQKVYPNSNTVFLKNVELTPSPRPSWRVPFGTGPTIRKIISYDKPEYYTYNPQSFYDLAEFIKCIDSFYSPESELKVKTILEQLPISIQKFLSMTNWWQRIVEINQNSSSKSSFTKRFYNWFDAFMVIKFLNFASKEYHPDINILKAARKHLQLPPDSKLTAIELLEIYRIKDIT